jgi:hypothetical protein
MKYLLLTFVFTTVTNILFGQTMVLPDEKEQLVLESLSYEIRRPDAKSVYYKHTFLTGYDYPAIKQGYYSIGIYEPLSGLITFYKEMSNLKDQVDGVYMLTIKTSNYGNIYAEKTGNRIKLYTSKSLTLRLKTFRLDSLIKDLSVLESMQNNSPN